VRLAALRSRGSTRSHVASESDNCGRPSYNSPVPAYLQSTLGTPQANNRDLGSRSRAHTGSVGRATCWLGQQAARKSTPPPPRPDTPRAWRPAVPTSHQCALRLQCAHAYCILSCAPSDIASSQSTASLVVRVSSVSIHSGAQTRPRGGVAPRRTGERRTRTGRFAARCAAAGLHVHSRSHDK